MDFNSLVGRINFVQDALQAQAAHAVNLSLTARNWLVGYYIVEFEQRGEDRAKYGDKLMNRLANRINRKGFEQRRLRDYRRIYLVYPQLGTEIATYIQRNRLKLPDTKVLPIWQSATAKLQLTGNQGNEIWQSTTAKLEEWSTPANRLFNRLNYTRQKRILVDQDYFKADLIFYHRILKCHVIVDLKIDRFRHEYASQLNLYLNYYKHEVMQEDDNPPIGLLLCTDYGETTVRYATEGLSENLFVSKYRLQLPSEEEIRNYLIETISEEDFKRMDNE